ncbi:Peptidoglycan O-acetyltransferase [compost metagenome]
MLFNSLPFLFLFLPAVALLYFTLSARGLGRTAMGWLVVASLFFYAWWNPAYLVLVVGSILFNFAVGTALGRDRPHRRLILILGVTANLALLGYYKYANFFLETVSGAALQLHQVALPLGISFFTFTQIAYLVDAYRGKTRDYDLLSYTLFVTFFPHLIAGPIIHHHDLVPQFLKGHTKFDHTNLIIGCAILLIGLFKKVILADSVAPYATGTFGAVEGGLVPSFLMAWGGAIAYTLQLYFDFSGYSDMAVGIARIFGITFPYNFNSPYKSRSIVEFWRRWHITLSQFLRDYLYIALGGNRKGPVMRYVNLMITMVLGGLWHGAGWTFIIWGALHGAYLVVNHGWRALTANRLPTHPLLGALGQGAAWGLTFLAVVVGWVFFRAANVPTALAMLKGMAGLNGGILPERLAGHLGALEPVLASVGLVANGQILIGLNVYVWLLVLLAVAVIAPNTQELIARLTPQAEPKPAVSPLLKALPVWGLGILAGMLFFIVVRNILVVAPSEFLYFNF